TERDRADEERVPGRRHRWWRRRGERPLPPDEGGLEGRRPARASRAHARLQQYTINLYQEIEKVSGQSCSIHLCGGLMLADTEERMDFLRMAVARGRYLGMELEMITPSEARDIFPVMDPQYFVGALYDRVEGHVDPTGVTQAYVKCAQMAGAEVRLHTLVTGLSQRPDET